LTNNEQQFIDCSRIRLLILTIWYYIYSCTRYQCYTHRPLWQSNVLL